MRYRLYSQSTGEPCDTVEMHVLAKAYRAAWRAAHACEPTHCHVLERLGLLIVFEWPAPSRADPLEGPARRAIPPG
jgi:hypothetical protein